MVSVVSSSKNVERLSGKALCDACIHFFQSGSSLQCISHSHIILVPKKDNPGTIADFRPIFLLNVPLKVITKLMADRLQLCITKLVHDNQYDFIKSRTIQDYLAWTFEYLHQCKQSKRQFVIINLDFEKAFDTIEHSFILNMLRSISFPDQWVNWTCSVLSSETLAVILNGVPGRQFACKRGVRQGDPLSPLLFVLASELLRILVNKAMHMGILNKPVGHNDMDFPIVQYADDTILVMQADAAQLFFLKCLLHSFAETTGLRVNYAKSMILPINVQPKAMEVLARTFGYTIGSFHFTT